MPQLNRMYCSNCKTSIYNCMIDGIRIPLLFYMVVGQPADTGPLLGINDPGVKLPSFVRAMMLPHVPVARVELCMRCVAEIFGVKLVTGEEDTMYSAEQEAVTKAEVTAVVQDAEIDEVNTTAKVMERPLLALKVGRGAKKAPKLPKARSTRATAPVRA